MRACRDTENAILGSVEVVRYELLVESEWTNTGHDKRAGKGHKSACRDRRSDSRDLEIVLGSCYCLV